MALVFMFLALTKVKPRLNWWLVAFASLSLVATRSATTILIYVVSVMVVLYWVAARRYGGKLLPVSLVSLMFGTVALFTYFLIEGQLPVGVVFEASLDSVGKDATLTGRTELWRWMSYEIAPTLGLEPVLGDSGWLERDVAPLSVSSVGAGAGAQGLIDVNQQSLLAWHGWHGTGPHLWEHRLIMKRRGLAASSTSPYDRGLLPTCPKPIHERRICGGSFFFLNHRVHCIYTN